MQHFLKALAGAARAQIVPPQLFGEVFVTVDDPVTLFDVGFRGESSAALTGPLERRTSGRFRLRISWRASCWDQVQITMSALVERALSSRRHPASCRALNPLHVNLLPALAGLGNLVGGLHPHERVHLHSEGLLDAQCHISGETRLGVQQAGQRGP